MLPLAFRSAKINEAWPSNYKTRHDAHDARLLLPWAYSPLIKHGLCFHVMSIQSLCLSLLSRLNSVLVTLADLFLIFLAPTGPQAGVGILCFLRILCTFLEMMELAWPVCFLFLPLWREMFFLMKTHLNYQSISSIRHRAWHLQMLKKVYAI